MCFKSIPTDDDIQSLENTGLEVSKKSKWDEMRIKFTDEPSPDQQNIVHKLIEQSRHEYGL